MATGHLFSEHLHNELFKHGIINEIDYVIADKRQLGEYKEALEDRKRLETAVEYKDRKAILDEVQDLLQNRFRSPKQDDTLIFLLHKLGLSLDEHGLVTLATHCPSKKPLKKHLGVKEPFFSPQERQLIEEEERLRVLNRDLRLLKDWLAKINGPSVCAQKPVYGPTTNWKGLEKRFRARTRSRMKQMEVARRRKISMICKDHDGDWRKILYGRKVTGTAPVVEGSTLKMSRTTDPDLSAESFSNKPKAFREPKAFGKPKAFGETSSSLEKKPVTREAAVYQKASREISDTPSGHLKESKSATNKLPYDSSIHDFHVPAGMRLRMSDLENPEIQQRLKLFERLVERNTRDESTETRRSNRKTLSALKIATRGEGLNGAPAFKERAEVASTPVLERVHKNDLPSTETPDVAEDAGYQKENGIRHSKCPPQKVPSLEFENRPIIPTEGHAIQDFGLRNAKSTDDGPVYSSEIDESIRKVVDECIRGSSNMPASDSKVTSDCTKTVKGENIDDKEFDKLKDSQISGECKDDEKVRGTYSPLNREYLEENYSRDENFAKHDTIETMVDSNEIDIYRKAKEEETQELSATKKDEDENNLSTNLVGKNEILVEQISADSDKLMKYEDDLIEDEIIKDKDGVECIKDKNEDETEFFVEKDTSCERRPSKTKLSDNENDGLRNNIVDYHDEIGKVKMAIDETSSKTKLPLIPDKLSTEIDNTGKITPEKKSSKFDEINKEEEVEVFANRSYVLSSVDETVENVREDLVVFSEVNLNVHDSSQEDIKKETTQQDSSIEMHSEPPSLMGHNIEDRNPPIQETAALKEDKIQPHKDEFDNRDTYISSSEKENNSLQQLYEEFNKLASEVLRLQESSSQNESKDQNFTLNSSQELSSNDIPSNRAGKPTLDKDSAPSSKSIAKTSGNIDRRLNHLDSDQSTSLGSSLDSKQKLLKRAKTSTAATNETDKSITQASGKYSDAGKSRNRSKSGSTKLRQEKSRKEKCIPQPKNKMEKTAFKINLRKTKSIDNSTFRKSSKDKEANRPFDKISDSDPDKDIMSAHAKAFHVTKSDPDKKPGKVSKPIGKQKSDEDTLPFFEPKSGSLGRIRKSLHKKFAGKEWKTLLPKTKDLKDISDGIRTKSQDVKAIKSKYGKLNESEKEQ